MKEQKFIILGAGVSGLSAYHLLKHLGKEVQVFNREPINHDVLSDHNMVTHSDQLLDFPFREWDVLILSPGIPFDHPIVQLMVQFKKEIWGEIELGFRFLQNEKIVAVTGSNGKTTTVTFLEKLFNDANIHSAHSTSLSARALGNIGIPLTSYVLETLKNPAHKVSWVILELSSFQLESLKTFRAFISLVLNVTMTHGERYADFDSYFRAKMLIFSRQHLTDHAILAADEKWDVKKYLTAQEHRYSLKKMKTSEIDLALCQLPGKHNLSNLAAAYEIAKIVGITDQQFNHTLKNFLGVEHRIEKVLGRQSRQMYRVFNDSKSSNWHATVAAMNCFEQERMILILGGQKRANQKVVELKDLKNRQLEKILCIGESGLDLSLELATIAPAVYINTIDQIPLHIPNEFRGVVLFSPAYPSFDQFKNYVDRGQQFKKLFF